MEDVLKKAREELIISLLSDKQYQPMKFKELCGFLNVPKDERNQSKASIGPQIIRHLLY